jgi:3-oxoacyl-[acyl-carrier-protein] synthase III
VIWKEKKSGKGKNVLVLKRKEQFLSKCVACAENTISNFMKKQGIGIHDIDLVIPSLSPAGFPAKLAEKMGIETGKIMDVPEHGNVLTAGPVVALERAIDEGVFSKARRVLFITVGAGIVVYLALYNNR